MDNPGGVRMDALKLLTQDHDELRKLFEEFESSSRRSTGTRQRLYDAIREELQVHAQIESEIFYPVLKESPSPDLRRLTLEAIEDHRIIDDLLEDLEDVNLYDEELEARMAVLRDNVV